MCRYTAYVGPDNPQRLQALPPNGDRILVGKFAYEFADPKRWDIIVFKFPGDATRRPHQFHQAVGRFAGRDRVHSAR